MLFEIINKKQIIKEVQKAIFHAQKEVLATMLLKDEIKNPLPNSYFILMQNKVKKGIVLKRLGFGRKEYYNQIKDKHKFDNKNYKFRYIVNESKYQRMILIDRRKLFFSIEDLYFSSPYEPFMKVFLDYFYQNFEKGKS